MTVPRSTIKKERQKLGFEPCRPRRVHAVRDVNKVKRVEFARQCLAADDVFDDVVFTDETTVQLGDNGSLVFLRVSCVISYL